MYVESGNNLRIITKKNARILQAKEREKLCNRLCMHEDEDAIIFPVSYIFMCSKLFSVKTKSRKENQTNKKNKQFCSEQIQIFL